MQERIDRLEQERWLNTEEMQKLLTEMKSEEENYLFSRAVAVRKAYYGNKIFMRGLIEFTSYCKNDCYYCGLRKSNRGAERYRLSKADILSCCEAGYALGFRTFVLQGGEDGYFTDKVMTDIVRSIRRAYPDCAITLSLGERSRESYEALFAAGADRYLLRHETASPTHYHQLHPPSMQLADRMDCLYQLKEIGYQVGCGMMVGSPGQTTRTLVDDLEFIRQLNPAMVGIGPFIPHHATPFAKEGAGTLEQTLRLLAIIRLMLPSVLLPATTALGTIHPLGREKGIQAGANVVMPNLSPVGVRKKYLLYDNKICTGDEAAECRQCMARRMEGIGYQVVVDRGDYVPFKASPEEGVCNQEQHRKEGMYV